MTCSFIAADTGYERFMEEYDTIQTTAILTDPIPMQTQQKNIRKTVVIIIAVMVVILLLFLNKITTPRYLSAIELKINGLVLLEPAQPLALPYSADTRGRWLLIYSDEEQRRIVQELVTGLKAGIQKKSVLLSREALGTAVGRLNYDSGINIGIINDSGALMGYFKPPFEQRKMILTYSSTVTHR